MKKELNNVLSVERAIDILECFEEGRTTLSLQDISDLLNIPKPSIFRILHTLVSKDYLIINEEQEYTLGLKFLRLSGLINDTMNIRNIAYPVMKNIANVTGETVSLYVLDKHERICLEKIESSHNIRNFVKVGERKTLIYGAAGKVLLAYQSDEYIHKTFKYYDIINNDFKDNIIKDLRYIKENRFYTSQAERVPGSYSIASPIFDYNKKVAYSIAVSGPSFRLKEESYTDVVIKSAAIISRKLGSTEYKNI